MLDLLLEVALLEPAVTVHVHHLQRGGAGEGVNLVLLYRQ